MAWHRIKRKSGGETLIVATLDGYDMDEWEATKIKANRAPAEFQTVNDDGSLATDNEAMQQLQRRAKFDRMTGSEIIAEVERMIAAAKLS